MLVALFIKKVGNKWNVYSEEGKLLGSHDTKEGAERQLAAVEANKHKDSMLLPNGLIYCLNAIAEKNPPKEFPLFKFGENPAYHFGMGEQNIEFTQTDAYKFLANNKNKKIMIDYDHGSLMMNSPNPAETSKAAGFGYLSLRDDGLYLTNIEWNPPAIDKLKNGEFRYVSPAYETNSDGEMERFINVALTNLPALQNNAEILNTRGKQMADEKEMQELKAELAATKLSLKQAEAVAKQAEQVQKHAAVEKAVDEAVKLGKFGNADRQEYLDFGNEFGVEKLNSLIAKLSRKLPAIEKHGYVQPTAEVAQPQGEVDMGNLNPERLDTILRALSAKGTDGVSPLIKSEEDKIKFLNKLADPKKTIEGSRFFNGWGDRFGKAGKGVK